MAFTRMLAVGGDWSSLGSIWMVETRRLADGSKVGWIYEKESRQGRVEFSTEQVGERSCCLGLEIKSFVLKVLSLRCLVDTQVGMLTSQLSI